MSSSINPRDLKARLGLPDNLDGKRIPSRALRLHCAAGTELLEAKEWASGIATRSGDEISAKLGREALARLTAIQRAMLTALERTHDLPEGSLTDYL